MRIGVLLPHGFFPWDIRVVKEVGVLTGGGHEVSVLCWTETGESASEQAMGAHLERMQHSKNSDRLGNLVLKMTGYRWHPIWTRRIKKFIKDNRIEALHTHDLRPALIGCRIGRKMGLPVVVDLHEDYATLNASAVRTLSARLFNSIRKIDRVEGKAVGMADRVIVTSPRYLELLPRRYGISPDKMVLVPNYQDLDSLVEPEEVEPIGLDPSRFTATFIGTIGTPGRGVQVAIEAMPLVLERIPRARLVIVGDGGYLPRLKDIAASLQLSGKVEFTGWVDLPECPGYVAAADVCLVTFLKEVGQGDICNPHKLFQYMAARKPVLVSDCYETSRHVMESGAGLVYDSSDPRDFADKLCEMESKVLRDAMAEKGYKAVKELYNFESLSDRNLAIYSDFQSGGV